MTAKIPETTEKEIISIYLENKEITIKEIKEMYKICDKTFYNILNRNNIKRIGQDRFKYSVDSNFFNVIDNELKAYWLGWMLSDGYVMYEPNLKNQVCLSLNTGDIKIIENFKNDLKYEGPICFEKEKRKESWRDAARIIISDTNLVQDLIKHGCTPRKSLTAEFPTTVPEALMGAFIRGYFEGDGTVGIYKNGSCLTSRISIICSPIFCDRCSEYLTKIGIHSAKYPDGKMKILTINRFEDKRKFINFIYNNPQRVLDRKYNICLDILKMVKCQNNQYKENLQKNLSNSWCYLSGPMEYAKDGGVLWRMEIIEKSKHLNIRFLDPTNKPGGFETAPEEKAHIQKLKNDENWKELVKYVKKFRRFDLRYTDLADFIICYIDPKVHMCGSYDEIFCAEREKKPRLAIIDGGIKNLPTWLFGVFDLDNIFSSVDECVRYLEKLDKGTKKLSNEWVLIRNLRNE